jgi:hypothetical protein
MEEQIANDPTIKWALEQASSLLSPLGNRWLHVQGVVRQAQWVSKIFDKDNQVMLIAAAYLHDIGYAPQLQKIGFHPLDGAYFLQSCNQERLASLVAYHSEAQFEAKLRGLESMLEQFPREHSEVADALTYCDLTTSPIGLQVSFKDRIIDIFHRYKKTDIVAQSALQAMSSWETAIRLTEQRLYQHDAIKP